MTDLAPIESSKPRWPAIISWAVILLTVGVIVTAQYLPEIRGKKHTARSGTAGGMQLELVAKYDEFDPISQAGKTAGGLGRSQLARKSVAGGLLYTLDEATRLRLWYVKSLSPYDPSAKSGPLRSRLGLFTAEVQTSF